MSADILGIYNFIKASVYRFEGLIAVVVFVSFLLLHFSKTDIFYENVVAILLLNFGIFCIWQFNRWYFKKFPKGNHGILVCIKSENDREKLLVKNDFLTKLNDSIERHVDLNLVLESTNDSRSEFLSKFLSKCRESILRFRLNAQKNRPDYELPLAIRLSKKRWERFKRRSKFKVYIWGKVSTRKSIENKGELTYKLEFNAIVSHSRISISRQDEMAKDIAIGLTPIQFPESSELESFEITADIFSVVSMYFVGIALINSDKDQISQGIGILEKLKEELQLWRHQVTPQIQYLNQKLPYWISEGYINLGYFAYQDDGWEKALYFFKKATEAHTSNYGAWIMRALACFECNLVPDAFASISYCKQHSSGDGMWRYSHAFLHMFIGNYSQALKEYEAAFASHINNERGQMFWILENVKKAYLKNPEKHQLEFLMGLIKFKKANLIEALEHFSSFILKCQPLLEFKLLVARSNSYKQEIEQIIDEGKL